MILNEFMQKVNNWTKLHFNVIECKQSGQGFEIYAADFTNQTKSQLLMYRTSDANDAVAMTSHFCQWLERANRVKVRRKDATIQHCNDFSVTSHGMTQL